ncbi:hypothetical protein [Nocardiopsis nanhaiensis]
MTSQKQNPQPVSPNAPRPSASQVTGARIAIYAQRHPVGYAARGALLAGAATVALMFLAATPALSDPSGAPRWVMSAFPAAGFVAALLIGSLLFMHGRGLPDVTETDAVRYASAKLQAASGAPGPDEEINRSARQLSDHLVRTSAPSYAVAPIMIVFALISARPLAEVLPPGFEPVMLTQLIPSFVLAVLMGVLYFSAKRWHERFAAFRAAYDRAAD